MRLDEQGTRTILGNILRAVFAALLATAGFGAPTLAAEPAAAAVLTIHADKPGALIDRHIYGQFAEHLGHGIYEGVWVGEKSVIPNEHGFRKDVIDALRRLKVPVVRWPGGCFADEYHWRDGIGPREKRPVTVNTNWGGVPEANQFGTHEFMEFVELIGADAYINGNLGTGTPREMAEWLQYLTSDQDTAITAERARNGHPKPWKIAYFAVGNESWGCGGNMSTYYYVDLLRQYRSFLKTPPGAHPQIIASGGYDTDTSWSEAISGKASEGVSAVSFHHYTLPSGDWQHKGAATGFGEDEWISTLAHTLVMDDFITRNVAALTRNDPANKIGLAVDEWGAWYDPEPGREPAFLYQQNTLRDALVAAINFNIFHHHADRVHLANIAQMVNVLQAMILTDGPRMVLTPTYHVFSMFQPFQDATLLPADVQAPSYSRGTQSVPALSVSAARSTDGAIVVALVNLDPQRALSVSGSLEGTNATKVSGSILSADAMDARNTFNAPHTVEPKVFGNAHLSGDRLSLTLPAKSVVVLRLQ
jgi:alpha-N-arabinofuranosidase